MKIIHTADWHLGQTLYGFDRTAEYQHFLSWLAETVRQQRPDALLIAGDIYDSHHPAPSAQRIFWDFLDQATLENPGMRVIITSGNHDLAEELDAPAAVYRRIGVQVRSQLSYDAKENPDLEQLLIPIECLSAPEEMAVIVAIPYLPAGTDDGEEAATEWQQRIISDAIHLAAKRFEGMPIVAMAHFFADGAIVNDGQGHEVQRTGDNALDAAALATMTNYMALGHLHKAQQMPRSDGKVWYAGSALAMNFGEEAYPHGVNLVNLSADGAIDVSQLEYKPLRQLLTFAEESAGDIEGVLKQIASLPKADKGTPDDDWPYVQLVLSPSDTDASTAEKIKSLTTSRQMRLCRVTSNAPQQQTGDTPDNKPATDLQYLQPALIARDAYQQAHGKEMPDEVARLLAEVKRACIASH